MTDTGNLTVAETATKLGLSTDQVYRRIHSGHLRAVQIADEIGKTKYLIKPEAIREYLDAGGEVNVDILPMLRVSHVCKITGFTADTVRQLIRDGHLDAVRGPGGKLGGVGHYRITRESVDRYMKNTTA